MSPQHPLAITALSACLLTVSSGLYAQPRINPGLEQDAAHAKRRQAAARTLDQVREEKDDSVSALAALKPGQKWGPGIVYFARAGADLGTNAGLQVDRIGGALSSIADSLLEVRITGYSDRAGSLAANIALSRRRARAVALRLSAAGGLSPERIQVIAGGVHPSAREGINPRNPSLRRAEIEVARPLMQPEDPRAPGSNEIVFFDPLHPPRSFFVTDQRYALQQSGSIDFWVAPDWSTEPGKMPDYDPVVLAAGSTAGIRYAVMVGRDRRSLLLWNGRTRRARGIPVDFTRPALRHVSLTTLGDRTYVTLDGEVQPLQIDTGYGQAEVTRLQLGSLARSEHPFLGRIGRLRIWRDAPDVTDLQGLPELNEAPNVHSTLYPLLIGQIIRTTVAGAPALELSLETLQPSYRPASDWWTVEGADAVRIRNREAFDRGSNPARVVSRLMDAGDPMAILTDVPAQLDGERLGSDPSLQIAAYPIYGLHETDAADGQILRTGLPEKKPTRRDRTSPTRLPDTVFVWADKRVNGLKVRSNDFDRDTEPLDMELHGIANWENDNGEQQDQPSAIISIHADEDIVAVSGRLRRDGRITRMRIYTNQRVFGPFGTDADGKRSTPFRLVAPEGLPVLGFESRLDSGPIRGLGLIVAQEARYPGLVLSLEDGRGLRFVREGRNRYRSLRPWLPLVGAAPIVQRIDLGAGDELVQLRAPLLEMIAPDRIRIQGVQHDFVALDAHPVPNHKVPFNDTFVTLSKAVNLQANYRGYDLVRMDPLHLVDTGVGGHVFRLPEGDSRSYHDYNRIFVPNGLIYVPEYTGRHHSTTDAVDSLHKLRKSYSRTVGVTLGGKLAPASFSASHTVTHARERIEEQNKTLTLGLTKATFYDLVLDKPRMQLDPRFRARVERLAEHLVTSPEIQRREDRHRYRALIRDYGTHYASAVIYGGLGVLQMEFDRALQDSIDASGESLEMKANVLLDVRSKARAGASVGITRERSEEFKRQVGRQDENFYWVGGTHAGFERQSWSVGLDGVVPVHVSLRPLHELLAPPFFEDARVTHGVRQHLRAAVDTYLERAGSNEADLKPYRVVLNLTRLECDQERTVTGWFGAETTPLGLGGSDDQVQILATGAEGQTLRPPSLLAKTKGRIAVTLANPDDTLQLVCKDRSGARIDLMPKLRFDPASSGIRFRLSAQDIADGKLFIRPRFEIFRMDWDRKRFEYFDGADVQIPWRNLFCADGAGDCPPAPGQVRARTQRQRKTLGNLTLQFELSVER